MSAPRAADPDSTPTPPPASEVRTAPAVGDDGYEIVNRPPTARAPAWLARALDDADELGELAAHVEAGRLYGTDTVRERAALRDGSHPVHRIACKAAPAR